MSIRYCSLLAATAALLAAAAPAAAEHCAADVRITDAIVQRAVDRATESSPTFRMLLREIAASDLIVYVVRVARERPAGATELLAHAGGRRYVRVTLRADVVGAGLAALIGHELQHVAEIARAPEAVDQSTLLRLYESIGRARCGPPRWCFDTPGAVAAGAQVMRELAGAGEPAHEQGVSRRE